MTTQTDIANRALQHVGAERIQPGAVLTEDSKNASEIRACYEIARRAEYRRNVWRFATRRVALRPLDDASRLVTFAAWSSATTYALNMCVTGSDGQRYQSRVGSNLNNDPTTDTTNWALYIGPVIAGEWDADTSYFAGELVYVSADVFLSLISGNEDATTEATWLQIDAATLAEVSIVYPIGAGPLSQSDTKNVYRLPAGYLMVANQNPKSGSVPLLGFPSNQAYRDWEYEGDYLLTQDSGVIIFRFVADIPDPNAMDPMFVEGFALRLALSICEPITQSNSKLSNVGSLYEKFMKEARIVNGVEKGAEEQELDSLIACRY